MHDVVMDLMDLWLNFGAKEKGPMALTQQDQDPNTEFWTNLFR